jgi:hypothetical protein
MRGFRSEDCKREANEDALLLSPDAGPPDRFRFEDYVTDEAAETKNIALVPTRSWQEKGHP